MTKQNQNDKIGMSKKQKLDRRWMIDFNREKVLSLMKESQIESPVGLVVDVTGKYGRRIAVLLNSQNGMKEDEAEKPIDEMIASFAKDGQYPTIVIIVSWGQAEKLLPLTSPTATETLKRTKFLMLGEQRLIVGIGTDGNTYEVIAV